MSQTLSQSQQFTNSAVKSLLNIEKDIEKRIKSEVYQKGIRIKDFFYDFDKLRKGFVTEDKFKTAIAMFNIFMTKEDVEELLRRYSIGNGRRLVKYDTFLENINSQFFDLDQARDNINQTKSKPLFDEAEAKKLNAALRNIKYTVKTKRILIKIPFQDFDRTKSGHVTKEQFTRVLTTLGINLDSQTYELLARKYMDNNNAKEVNYIRFWQEVDDLSELNAQIVDNKKNADSTYVPQDVVEDTTNIDFLGSLYLSKRLATDKDTDEIEKKIQAAVVLKKLRVKEFFKDFDGLRKGTVTTTQFRRILNMTGITLNDDEFDSLLKKYRKDDLVVYRDFVENIDRIFTTKGIEKDPLYKVDGVDNNTTLAARRKFLNLSDDEYNKLVELTDLYRSEISNKRILLKPHFEDFDKTKSGHISKNQFLRILTQFSLLPDKQSLNILFKRYTDKGNLDEVNYYDFCKDVDLYNLDAKEISKTHAESFKDTSIKLHTTQFRSAKNDVPNDLEDLLSRLKKKIKQDRIRIQEFLRDFDKLRSGAITNTQFRLGLDMAGLSLSNQEFDLLVEHFKHETRLDNVRWKDFCDRIEEVFTTKSLEKQPLTNVTNPNLQFNYGRQPLTQEEVAHAGKVIRRFTYFARANRLDIKQFFKDWDRLNRSRVSPKQFRQVLATLNFILSDPEFNAVIRYYQAEDNDEVKYVEFINDCNIYSDMVQNADNGDKNAKKEPHQISNEAYKSIYLGLGTTKTGNVDFNDLLGRIKNHIKINQIRVEDYFKDFDGLRKGVVTSNKFRGVLSKMKVELNDEELVALENRYKIQNTTEYPEPINYSAFIEEIGSVFTQKGLEKDPLTKPQSFQATHQQDSTRQLSRDEEQQFHEYMLELGNAVYTNRILIKPYFQDKDKTKSGKVSFPRFRSVLDVLKLPITNKFYELLCRRFSFEGKEFNYVEFIEVLKKYSEFD